MEETPTLAHKQKEYVIRAPGPQHAFHKYFVGKFPLGPPQFKSKKKGTLRMVKEIEKPTEEAKSDAAAPRPAPWVIEEQEEGAFRPLFRGQVEGGLSKSAGYFLLVKEENGLVALPVQDWYNFRPVPRHQTMTLEEAEEYIKKQRTAQFANPNSKLALLSVAGGGEEGDDADVFDGADDSDEEGQGKKKRGAARKKGGAKGSGKREAEGSEDDEEAEDGDEEEGKEGEHTAGKMKKEDADWEHDHEAADDDLDMGDTDVEEDSPEVPVKRGGRAAHHSDSEDDHLSAHGKEMAKLLRKTGMSSDEESLDDEDDIEDEDDLDILASKVQPGVAVARTRAPTPQPSSAQARKGNQRGRSPTPPVTDASKGVKRKADVKPEEQPKKVKVESAAPARAATPPPAPRVKAEPTAAAPKVKAEPTATSAKVKVESVAAAVGDDALVTAEEMISLLKKGPIALKDFSTAFKKRLKTKEQKRAFTLLAKSVATIEEVPKNSGNKFMVLKEKK